MTTVTVKLQSNSQEILKDALVSACHYYSASKISGEFATLTYICENGKKQAIQDVHDSINPEQLELLGVELVAIEVE